MKKTILLFWTIIICIAMCACGAETAIVGTWCVEGQEGAVITFTDEGQCFSEIENSTYDYMIEDDQLILINQWNDSQYITYSIHGDKLELSANGYTTVLIRQ